MQPKRVSNVFYLCWPDFSWPVGSRLHTLT